jgi:hypothetical protein
MYKYIDSTVFITENEMPKKDIYGRDVSSGKGGDYSGSGYDAPKAPQPTIEFERGKGIEDFKAQMRSGFARPNLFRVDIGSVAADKGAKYRMSCFQAQIPGVSLSTTDKDIGFRSVAYQKLFADMTLGFYVSSGLEEIQFWQSWIDYIVDAKTNHFKLPKSYYGTVTVTQISRTGGPSAQWTFHDIYPKAVDPIAMDYGTNDSIMTMNTTLTYRHYTHRFLDEQTATSIAADVSTRQESDFRNVTSELRGALESTIDKAGGFFDSLHKKETNKGGLGNSARQGFAIV